MANGYFQQFLFSKVRGLTMLQGQVTFGAAGAVSAASGVGLVGVTKLTTGIYKIQIVDDFQAFVGASFSIQSGVTGANIADGSFVANTLYQITAVGTTNWAAIGLPAGLTAAVGQAFVATGIGGAGTGTAKVVTTTGVLGVEVVQNAQTELYNTTANQGAILIAQTLDAAGALVSPTSGAIISFMLYFRNSSVVF